MPRGVIGTAAGRLPPPPAARGRNRKAVAPTFLPDFTVGAKARQAPPPPNEARDGRVTISVKASAVAASAAVPPCARIERATSAATGSSATTAPDQTAGGGPLTVGEVAGAGPGAEELTVDEAAAAQGHRQGDQAGGGAEEAARGARRASAQVTAAWSSPRQNPTPFNGLRAGNLP